MNIIEEKILNLAKKKNKSLNFQEYSLKLKQYSYQEIGLALNNLVNLGYLRKSKNDRYVYDASNNIAVGQLRVTQKGFGFINFKDGEIFIPRKNLLGAISTDTVRVRYFKEAPDRYRGEVESIISREYSVLTGRVVFIEGLPYFLSFNDDIKEYIPIKTSELNGAKKSNIVRVKILPNVKKNWFANAKVIKVLSKTNDTSQVKEATIESYGIEQKFSSKILHEANLIKNTIHQKGQRLDLRDDFIITIDSITAKDLDDAVSLDYKDGIYTLGVHIADVSEYVLENTLIDAEALKRGTSVYLVDRVIPMLPSVLSDDLCSLNPNTEKLTLSVIMNIDEKGNVIDHKIAESLIVSKYRGTYEEFNSFLSGEKRLKSGVLEEKVKLMYKLMTILSNKRQKQGAIEFDFKETYLKTDQEGNVVDIYPFERGVSEKIIEEFMLLTNIVVAENFYWLELPFLYRIHEKPQQDKILALNKFLKSFGFRIKGDKNKINASSITDILDKLENNPIKPIISKMVLRSLNQAKYSDVVSEHFGLATEYYSHFTSPIRRYPDLQIHRIIKDFLHGRLNEKKLEHYNKILSTVALKSSVMERKAEKLERKIQDIEIAKYMKQFIGREFSGVIVSVTNFGFFVSLENTVEGLVHISTLRGVYSFDSTNLKLENLTKGASYKIGDRCDIILSGVDIENGKIDFILKDDIND